MQGQEVFSFSSPYGGAEASRKRLSDMRCYPNLNVSRSCGEGNGIRHLHADARSSFEKTVLGDSFKFHKVLQGQETMPILSYGRGPEANQVQEKNIPNVINDWSTLNQYNTRPHPSPSFVPGSSASSVLLVQKSSPQTTPFCDPQRTTREDLRGFRSNAYSEVHDQMTFMPTQPLSRDKQNFVSMCKNSCRLFGFSLTEEKNIMSEGEITNASASSYVHESNSLARNEEQLFQPPLMSKVMISSCTKVSDMHAVRDRLLDIAL